MEEGDNYYYLLFVFLWHLRVLVIDQDHIVLNAVHTIFPILQMRNQGKDRLSDLSRVTHDVCGRAGNLIHIFGVAF